MAYSDDISLSYPMEMLRKKFLGGIFKDSGIRLKKCEKMEVFIFNYGTDKETGLFKIKLGNITLSDIKVPRDMEEMSNYTYLQNIISAFKEPEILDDHDRKFFTQLIPMIEAKVKIKDKNGNDILSYVGLKSISVLFDYVDWHIEWSYELADGFKKSERYPEIKK